MILDRIPWACEHDSPLRIIVLSLYLWSEVSKELGDVWEAAGHLRPFGLIKEFKGAEFYHGYQRDGLFFADGCTMSMEDVLKVERSKV